LSSNQSKVKEKLVGGPILYLVDGCTKVESCYAAGSLQRKLEVRKQPRDGTILLKCSMICLGISGYFCNKQQWGVVCNCWSFGIYGCPEHYHLNQNIENEFADGTKQQI